MAASTAARLSRARAQSRITCGTRLAFRDAVADAGSCARPRLGRRRPGLGAGDVVAGVAVGAARRRRAPGGVSRGCRRSNSGSATGSRCVTPRPRTRRRDDGTCGARSTSSSLARSDHRQWSPNARRRSCGSAGGWSSASRRRSIPTRWPARRTRAGSASRWSREARSDDASRRGAVPAPVGAGCVPRRTGVPARRPRW